MLFTVNTVLDNLGHDGGLLSLRQAIVDANASANVSGPDTIAFCIPGAGVHTISPTSPLPDISDPVTINGYTQSGASANTNGPGLGDNAVLTIELDGSQAGAAANGLVVTAGNTTIQGLVVNRFGGSGIGIVTDGNRIEGNFIGTDVTGKIALGNAAENGGVFIFFGYNNTIGGATPEARNLISGNVGDGIRIVSDHSIAHNEVLGNFIGTDICGTSRLPNFSGIRDFGGSDIGGDTAGAGNLISGNIDNGVFATNGGTVQGNLIGTDVTGTHSIGNGRGVLLAANETLGGTTPEARNIISGNLGDGAFLEGDNVTQGNYIGTDITGAGPLGNGANGLHVGNGTGNMIGGIAADAGNTIAFNHLAGVYVSGDVNLSTGASILGNSIHDNGGIGINLGMGANNNQAAPVLTAAYHGVASTLIQGTLNSVPDSTFTVEFFANTALDGSGYGEGERFLGRTTVHTDLGGNVSFAITVPSNVPVGQFVTATATDAANNTSEFSAGLVVVPSPVVDTTTTITAASATYDGNSHGATALVGPGSPAGTKTFLYTGTGDTVYSSSTAPTNAGTYHVVATFTPDNPDAFNPSSDATNYTINKASICHTIGNATHVYGSTVNLAAALGATFATGVHGENLAIAYSSTGNTVTANAGSYAITGVVSSGTGLASNYTVALTPGTLTVTQKALTGDSSTQDALNMAKQGKLTITVSNVAGLVNGDTLITFLSTAEYYITVGANKYVFIPTTVTTSGNSITVDYSLKNSALATELAAELADNTSAATAVTAGFFMESANYTFTDEYLTRLFSTLK